MLDVFAMGVVVVVIASGQAYNDSGVELHLREGLMYLVLAEAVHYIAFYQVNSMCDYFSRKNASCIEEPSK